jgi:hypothetical protein
MYRGKMSSDGMEAHGTAGGRLLHKLKYYVNMKSNENLYE